MFQRLKQVQNQFSDNFAEIILAVLVTSLESSVIDLTLMLPLVPEIEIAAIALF